MSDPLDVRLVLSALRYVDEGLSERAAFARSVADYDVRRGRTLRRALMLLMEVSKRRIRYDRTLERLGLSNVDPAVKPPLYVYLYYSIDNLQNRGDVCELLRVSRGFRGMPREVERSLASIGFARESMRTHDPSRELEDHSLKFSCPPWFVEYSFRLLGRPDGIRFLRSCLGRLPPYLRVNTLRGDEASTLDRLKREGVRLSKVDKVPYVYRVDGFSKPPTRLDSWREGLFSSQDFSSCLVGYAADPKPYEEVLDLCSAPGGKTSHIAQIMNNLGKIYSIDFSHERMKLWGREMKRLGVEVAEPVITDVKSGIPLDVEVDLALLDPPCTGTGVLMKNPSMKSRLTRPAVKSYSRIQWEMLVKASEKVKKGGRLVYFTCSITREENEDLISRFLGFNHNFELVDLRFDGFPRGLYLDECIRLYPHLNMCNGAFIAKLKRSS